MTDAERLEAIRDRIAELRALRFPVSRDHYQEAMADIEELANPPEPDDGP